MNKVDTSGSGEIEFDEFLAILKGGGETSQFFKDMSKGKIGSKDLSFNIIVQDYRRKAMLDSLVKDKRANIQLNWCKENNFEEDTFVKGGLS